MVIFTVRALATMFKVGPKAIRFATANKKVLGHTFPRSAKQAIATEFVQAKFRKISINFGLEVTGGDEWIANKVIGGTVKPITRGKITNVDDAGNATIVVLKSFKPGGAKPRFKGLAKGFLLASLPLPFVKEEVIEDVLEKIGTPKFIVTIFRATGVLF